MPAKLWQRTDRMFLAYAVGEYIAPLCDLTLQRMDPLTLAR